MNEIFHDESGVLLDKDEVNLDFVMKRADYVINSFKIDVKLGHQEKYHFVKELVTTLIYK